MTDKRVLIETRNRTVAIEGGTVVEPSGPFDMELRFLRADVRPGLINAHEHLHRNHYGRLGTPPYPDGYAWARDIQLRNRREIEVGRVMPRRKALLAGAWKNLFAGVTTIVHHDVWETDFERNFPVRVTKVDCADSLGMTPELEGVDSDGTWSLHLAEGTTEASAREVDELGRRGLLKRQLLAVHGVGMDAPAVARFRASGAALVWCPSSNLFLFGCTASAELLAEGIDVLLGGDSLLTGAGDLLDELRVARQLGLLSDQRLEDAVGQTAARRLGLPLNRLEPGDPADLVVLSRPLLAASAGDVELVMVEGSPRVASLTAARQLEAAGFMGELMTSGGLTRWTCGPDRAVEPVL